MNANVIEKANDKLVDYADEFLRLARRISMGEEIDPVAVANVCADARKSPPELADLVGNLKHRIKLREKLATAKNIEAQLAAVQAEREAAEAAFAKAVQIRNDKVGPLVQQAADLVRQNAEAGVLPSQLMRTCPDPALVRRNRELQNKLRAAHQLGHDLQLEIRSWESTQAGRETAADKAAIAPRLNNLRERLATARRDEAAMSAESELVVQAMIDF